VKKSSSFLICSLLAFCSAALAAAQTFEIEGEQQHTSTSSGENTRTNVKSDQKGAKSEPGSGGQLGWGSSIEVGRNARAAEDALRRGNPSAAADFAARAVKAAPRDAKLWFLLGYTSRLAGRYAQSLQAYDEGLQLHPGDLDGLSGKAQTYDRMGRTDEAKKLLLQVINANPRRENDLLMAGELFIRTNDLQEGIRLLGRAETMHPTSHAELMMAVAYLKLKQPERARQLLDQARTRDPHNPMVFRAVANYYREEHDYKSAIATLRNSPVFNSDVLADLGYSYELNGDKQEAADSYAKAAKLAPNQIGLQLSAAAAFMRLALLDKTREYLARAQQLDANHYRLHALRALLARAEDRNPEAIREYNAAIANLPQGVPPEGQLYPIQLRLNLSELYRDAGDDMNARRQIAAAEQMMDQLHIEGTARAEFLRVRAAVKTAGQDYNGAESDLQQAQKLDPENLNITLQYAALLWKMDRKQESRKTYTEVLQKDPRNRLAMEGLGYLARDEGDAKTAEKFFDRYASEYPDDYVPFLALGDLYTATREFAKAELNYQKAYKLAPANAIVVANGANAAIEARQIPLAGEWIARAKGKMLDDPRVMLETERYLFHSGKYLESAQIGYKVVQLLPKDRNASVYLGYDLYNLGRFDDVLGLAEQYESILPAEANFPLLAGHVHKQNQLLGEAVDDYSRAIERDPNMVDAYVNRGYVRNDTQDAEDAVKDFETALRLSPDSGVAHLGMAFAQLELRHGRVALEQVDFAAKQMGESGATHLARATAYRQQRLMRPAEREYHDAIRYAPDDLKLQLALADTQYRERHYVESIHTLNDALRLSPDDPLVYASLAHAYAELHDRERTLRYVAAAEKTSSDQSAILLNTGDALLTLGDRQGAMERFTRALQAPDGNRVEARLAIARLFEQAGKADDARQQISLALAEARIGEAEPVSADNLIEAGNLLLAMNDFDLASRYFQRAKTAGAADEVVALGMANTFVAQGETVQAQSALNAVASSNTFKDNYDYALTMGNIYRQRHDNSQAMLAFARANLLGGGEDEIAQRSMQEAAGREGIQVTKKISADSDVVVHGLLDDITIYELNALASGATPSTLPGPFNSLETIWTNGFRMHQQGLPLISGFFQLRNAIGQFAFPNEGVIINRNTFDYNFNGALNPVLHIGRNSVAFNTGLQFTVRRDLDSPAQINQNLFRQFVYLSSSAFGNWLAIDGAVFHEAGPFLEQSYSSSESGARIQFTVGRPWGRTQLITAYTVRDLKFNPTFPQNREFYSTVASGGLQHQFGKNLKVAILADYIRSWRVQQCNGASVTTTSTGPECTSPGSPPVPSGSFFAQALRPAGVVHYKFNNRWSADANFSLSRGEGFHFYDNVQNSFFISYTKPIRRSMEDVGGSVPVEYPLRFSFGIETADYYDFTGHGQAIVYPMVRLTVF
jgi:tetratricopeptide (TPR) repeat protein